MEVAPVEASPNAEPLVFSGSVRARDRAQLSFLVGGRIRVRSVEVGDRVDRGQMLARLDDTPFSLAVAAASARLAETESQAAQWARDLGRAERLAHRGAAGNEEVEKLKAGLLRVRAARDAAPAQRNEAQRQLKETRLSAPFAGTVLAMYRETTEMTSVGTPVVELSAEDGFEVELMVPEGVRARLSLDSPVEIRWPLADMPHVKGRLTSLGRGARGPAGLFPVVITLPPVDHLAPGFTAEVTLHAQTDTPLTVPLAAVANPGGGTPFVFVVKNERALRVPVEVGRLNHERIGVKGKLQIGDEVIVSGHASLLNGEAVTR